MSEHRGYIDLNTKHEYSESPKDNGFAYAKEKLKTENPSMAVSLEEISRSKSKMKVLDEAFTMRGKRWTDLIYIRDNPQALEIFRHLISFWDSLSEQQRIDEADKLAKALV